MGEGPTATASETQRLRVGSTQRPAEHSHSAWGRGGGACQILEPGATASPGAVPGYQEPRALISARRPGAMGS